MRLFDPAGSMPLRAALELEAAKRGLVVADHPLGGYVLQQPNQSPQVRTRNTKEA